MILRTTTRPINLPAPLDPNYRHPYISREDADIAHAAGITLPEWEAMTDTERADVRYRMGAMRGTTA
ncbi:hypothetical protein [Arthrobacter sp. ISL-69]|uniref:hypothetical protein n=1 Tax=Arthrobacter sp. ISL-69 TaxID=2819113 RepID=UPI001BEC15D6|nr:hypothetical protein [Arthrobacter sp. ISL-69]MBT2537233.1 hypothetical protein [Arthrobacter sp. ISL-69]